MIESAYYIEDLVVKKGQITLKKDKNNDNGNGKDKEKPWIKNKYVVNDGEYMFLKPKSPSLTWLMLF